MAGEPCGLLNRSERNRGNERTSMELLFFVANLLLLGLARPQLLLLEEKLGATRMLRRGDTQELISRWKESVSIITILVTSFILLSRHTLRS